MPDKDPDPGGVPDDLSQAERLRLFEDVIEGARRGAVGRFASSLSHALGTPLNVIAGRAAMIGMMQEVDANDARENARIIEAQVKNITELLQRALSFARQGAPAPEPFEVRALTARVVDLLRPIADARNVRIELGPGDGFSACAPASRVFDVAVSIAAWGVNHAPAGAAVVMTARIADVQPPPIERGRARGGRSAIIEVACGGASLPLAQLESVYEPWLVQDIEDRETALTLAVAFGIAREHRGWIEAAVDASGTTFSVCWPI